MGPERTDRAWWFGLSRSERTVLTDLVVLLGVLVVMNVVLLVPAFRSATIAGARLQTLVAVPVLFWVPGYVLVAVLFPGRSIADRGSTDSQSVDLVQRAALSFGMSLALLPVFAVIIGTLAGYSRLIVLTGLTVVLLAGIILAAVRRLRLQSDAAFGVPVRRLGHEFRRWLRRHDGLVDGIGTVAFVLAVLVAVGAAGVAVATPYQSDGSSTLYLVTENETGAWTASDYPTEFTAGEERSLAVAIENNEGHRQDYTVVIAVERVRADGPEQSATESRELDRFRSNVPDRQTWTGRHTVAPERIGEDIRLQYYLYKGESAPADPDPSTAYRDVYLWIEVDDS